ncbi:cytochrome oxidase c subunit VIb-domain-containing protein [Aspergillus unguis]
MGWLPWSSKDTTQSSDGGRIAPDRSSRQKCWEGRDKFFACLDNNDIIDSVKGPGDKEARSKCAKEIAEFEGACSAAWTKYFKEKRVMEYNRDKTIERIKKEDAATIKDLKSQGWNSK